MPEIVQRTSRAGVDGYLLEPLPGHPARIELFFVRSPAVLAALTGEPEQHCGEIGGCFVNATLPDREPPPGQTFTAGTLCIRLNDLEVIVHEIMHAVMHLGRLFVPPPEDEEMLAHAGSEDAAWDIWQESHAFMASNLFEQLIRERTRHL